MIIQKLNAFLLDISYRIVAQQPDMLAIPPVIHPHICGAHQLLLTTLPKHRQPAVVLGVALETEQAERALLCEGTRLIQPGDGKLWRCFVERSITEVVQGPLDFSTLRVLRIAALQTKPCAHNRHRQISVRPALGSTSFSVGWKQAV